jgi:ribosomal protein S18 acetylase RimI-like enzyme
VSSVDHPVVIRAYQPADAGRLRACVVALQEFERAIDPRLRPGEAMADAYCEQLHARCRASDGRVFVAEQDGTVVGFVAVLAREPFTELDDPPGTYAFVTDLVVLSDYRGHGTGRQLLDRAEAFARAAGAPELRIGVLADNLAARTLYLSADFVPHVEVFTKRWESS